jgi:hypothetical protein
MLKPADWKFQEKATKWHQLEALVDFDRLYLIAADKDPETLKKQLQVLNERPIIIFMRFIITMPH